MSAQIGSTPEDGRHAAAGPPFPAVIDADDLAFLHPGDMPTRIAAAPRRTEQRPPESPAEPAVAR